VFAAGDLPAPSVTRRLVRRRLAEGPFVVAADGGLVHAAALGIEPHLIVGDLDSVPPELLGNYPPHLIERHAVAKDELDLELALAAAIDKGARDVSVLGAFGDRFDQSLAALLIAARLAREGSKLDLHGGGHSAWPLAAGMALDLDHTVGTTISVLALAGDAVVSAEGLAYPLVELRLPFGSGLGVSNTVAGTKARVTCLSGVIAVVAEY
jgi:thiamine pyrophosphokinase